MGALREHPTSQATRGALQIMRAVQLLGRSLGLRLGLSGRCILRRRLSGGRRLGRRHLGGLLLRRLGGVGSSLFFELGSALGLLGGLGLTSCLLGSCSLCSLGLTLSLLSSLTLELDGCSTSELVCEALDAATGVDELLLAGVEGVALIAQVNRHRGDGRARNPRVAAAAAHGALDVLRMDTFLHGRTPL